MGPVYLAQFTIENNQNVGKYTIHGSYGCVCILLLSSSNKMSSAVWGRPKDCLHVRSERKSACWLFFKAVILFLWLALRSLIVFLNLTLLLKSPTTSMKWKGWRYNIPEITLKSHEIRISVSFPSCAAEGMYIFGKGSMPTLRYFACEVFVRLLDMRKVNLLGRDDCLQFSDLLASLPFFLFQLLDCEMQIWHLSCHTLNACLQFLHNCNRLDHEKAQRKWYLIAKIAVRSQMIKSHITNDRCSTEMVNAQLKPTQTQPLLGCSFYIFSIIEKIRN